MRYNNVNFVGYFMKITAVILGIFFILFGAMILFGGTISLVEGDSEYLLVVDVIGMIFLGVVPVAGGIYVIRLRNANSNGVAMIKTGRFFVGVFTILLGCTMTQGAAIMIAEAPADTPDYLAMGVFVFFGLGAVIGGLALCRHAMRAYFAGVDSIQDDIPDV